jgi:hypothetical protein
MTNMPPYDRKDPIPVETAAELALGLLFEHTEALHGGRRRRR